MNRFTGKDMKLATEWVTPREVKKWAEETLGEEVVLKEIDEEAWTALRSPQMEEIWLNIQCFYTAPSDYRDVEMSLRVLPGAKTVKHLIQEWGKGLVQETSK
jgi:hypothetical protein